MLAIISACGHQGCSERHQRELCDFEALQSEWDSDDRNAESHAMAAAVSAISMPPKNIQSYIDSSDYAAVL
jgi:hypothetical protein